MTTTAQTEGERALFAERLTLLYRVLALAPVAALAAVRLAGAGEGQTGLPQDLSFVGLAAMATTVLVWLRRSTPSLAALWRADGMGLLGGWMMLFVLAWVGPESMHARYNALCAAVFLFALRATLLPNPPRVVALQGAAVLMPLAAPALGVPLPWDVPQGSFPRPIEAGIFSLWTAVGLSSAVLISRVIYDLRREARRARRVGPYELVELVGRGGAGEVYRATHQLLRRPTAVKLLRPDRAGELAIARFEQEVQLTASLTHPNTVAVYDYGRTADRLFYFAMEYVDGLNLDELVQRSGPLPPPRAVHLLRQIAGSLAEAHAAGLVHRDVKAANVMVCQRIGRHDVAKVLDFGLARVAEAPDVGESRPGLIAGTPSYLAPEAWFGAELATARSDLYSVGVVAYVLLAGRTPFDDRGLAELCAAHARKEPPPLDSEPALAALVSRLLAKEPAERPTALQLGAELEALAQALPPWTARQAESWWADQERQRPTALPETVELSVVRPRLEA